MQRGMHSEWNLRFYLAALLCSVTTSHSARLMEPGYEVETILDGRSIGISPSEIASDAAGNVVFLLDTDHSNVFKFTLPLSPNSTKELLAGSSQGISGYADGFSQDALFNHPGSLTIDEDNVLYLGDRLNHAIRRICDDVVTTIAGCNTSEVGHVDGPGEYARFSANYRVQYIPAMSSLLIADVGNRMIRRIKMDENCSSTSKLAGTRDCMVSGGAYFVDTIFDGNKLNISPYSIHAAPTKGYIFMLDSKHNNILRLCIPVDQNSTVQHYAGSIDGQSGYVDGDSEVVLFTLPRSMTLDSKGNIYVADIGNNAVRKISSSDRRVTTIAGGSSGIPGYVDGQGMNAKFSNDFIVHYVPSTCSLLVLDKGNSAIRQIKLQVGDCPSNRSMLSGRVWEWAALALSLIFGIVLSRKHILRGLHLAWQIMLILVLQPLKTCFYILMQIPIQIRTHSYAMRNMAANSNEGYEDNFTEQPFLDQVMTVSNTGPLLDMDHSNEMFTEQMPLFLQKHLEWPVQTLNEDCAYLKPDQIDNPGSTKAGKEEMCLFDKGDLQVLGEPTHPSVSEASEGMAEAGSRDKTDDYGEDNALSDSTEHDKLKFMIDQNLEMFEKQGGETAAARPSLNQIRQSLINPMLSNKD